MWKRNGRVLRAPKLAVTVVLGAMLVAACGNSGGKTNANTGTSGSGSSSGGLKVALLLPGRINDKGWDTIGYNALQEAKQQFGAQVAYTENVGPADEAADFRSYAAQGYNVVLAMGGQYVSGAQLVAKQFPQVKFGIIGGNYGNGSNVASFNAHQEQVFYIAGLIAAKVSKSKKVAYMSGLQVDNTVRGWLGFKQGAQAGGATAQAIWTGDFEDVNKAKEATTAAFNQGADVVQVNSNAANIGAIEAAQQGHAKALGVYGDLTSFGPDAVVTNVIPAMDKVIVEAVRQAKQGKWGGFYLYGFKEIPGLVTFTPFNGKAVPSGEVAQLQQLVKATEAKLVAGQISVQGP